MWRCEGLSLWAVACGAGFYVSQRLSPPPPLLLLYLGAGEAGHGGGGSRRILLGACWKMDLVASLEGGAQTAACDFRQRSESEARMLTQTVRSRGWCSLVLWKVLASCSCWSAGTSSVPAAGAPTAACGWPAEAMTSAGMVRVCCSCCERSRGSVRTDIFLLVVVYLGHFLGLLLLGLLMRVMIFTLNLPATAAGCCFHH